METLGYAEDADRVGAAELKASLPRPPLHHMLDDEARHHLLLTDAMKSPPGQVFSAITQAVTRLFPSPHLSQQLFPVESVEDAALLSAISDVRRTFGVEPEVLVARGALQRVVVMAYPRPVVVVDETLLGESDAARRFLFGWAFESIRGGYSILFSLGRRERVELGNLLRSLLRPEAERVSQTNDFVRSLPSNAVRVIDEHAGSSQTFDADAWIEGVTNTARRAGLLVSDDFAAATRMIGLINGESVGVGNESTAALGTAICGEDLVRFYLSEEYRRLRGRVSQQHPAGAA